MHRHSYTFSTIGRATGWGTFLLGIVYALITLLGFLSLKSLQDPIGDPFFTLMELLTILIATLMAITLAAVHYHASPEDRVFSLAAVLFMFAMTGITTCVHFVILTTGRPIDTAQSPALSQFLSFKWPSVAYALDILAWDWFFPLSILLAAPVFKNGRLEKTLRILMSVCGCISLAGLAGVPLANMQVRNIGIIGYGLIAPVVFLLLGIVVGRSEKGSISK
jgi:hypothetical protein